MVVQICKEDDGTATKENFIKVNSALRTFSKGVYETMDEYYCTEYCPCKVEASAFKDAEADKVSYYSTLNITGNETVSFQWCASSMAKVTDKFSISFADFLFPLKESNFEKEKEKYDKNKKDY